METTTALDLICRLPDTFHAGDKSFVQIVRDSGVSKNQLEVEALRSILQVEPSLVEGWLLWSINKRVSSGWYFQSENGRFVVGLFPDGEKLVFQDAATGCAEFICREVGQYAL